MKKLPVIADDVQLDRRELLQLVAAGAGVAGLGAIAGCMEPPRERIRPRVEDTPELVPGVPRAYATAFVLDGFATGIVVKTHEARPIKVEGNPDHPASLGATTAYEQASVLELYDPDRLQITSDRGMPVDLAGVLRDLARREPIADLWLVMPPQSSPLVGELMARVKARHPGVRFATHAAIDRRAVYLGAQRAFGRALEAQYHFDRADVVVSLDADFLAAGPNSIRWARDFAARRRLRSPTDSMSQLFVAEPAPSPTGSLADRRLAVPPSRIAALATALLGAVRGRPLQTGDLAERRWINAAAAALKAERGIVIAGERQPAEVHHLVHAIAAAIDALGTTIELTEPALIEPLGDGMPELLAALRAGRVGTLVIADANPVYDVPELGELIARAPETICVSQHPSETTARCQRILPLAHAMEAWGDARGYDGTVSIIQPLIRPLRPCVSIVELLAALAGDDQPDGYRLLRARYPVAEPTDLAWRKILKTGVVPNTALPAIAATPREPASATTPATGIEIAFTPSASIHDGRFANNGWLQELPKPHSKITWSNAALLGPATAAALEVTTEDVIRIERGEVAIEIPVYVLPGHAEGCVTVELGYGRAAGTIARGVGVDVTPLRFATAGFVGGATLRGTGKRRALAITQRHFDQHRRQIAPIVTLARFRADPDVTAELRGPLPSLLPESIGHEAPQWGMTIDTMICTGCSACMVACRAENNIPIVGADEVERGRDMHWLRIDTYREDDGDVVHQPMLCQHCEAAPCEYVCPVYATQHSPDGLNEMIYNRCVGTRFCSNNCPYKVRRFNWFDFTEDTPELLRLQRNPAVTVRARGVMEKCTFCVQRIRGAEIAARKEQREIGPGEVTTACQQACPTGAIQFGALHHDTEMTRRRREPRSYAVLHELGTRPRTIYLAKIRNGGGE